MLRKTAALSLILATGVAVLAGRQSTAPNLRILSPENGGYVSGEVVIKAAIDDAAAVERMNFFVDGRLTCTVERPPFECAWNSGPDIQEHVFRVKAYLRNGARPVEIVRTKGVEQPYREDVDVVHVTVTVLDGSTFARGLTQNDFAVYEDDRRQPITYFEAENSALELVAAIDVSSSMTPAIDDMKTNITYFLSAMPARSRVTLLSFNDNYFVLTRPSMDLAARQAAVDRLDPWGATALHDVLFRSFEMLGRQAGRRAIVMFTDGDDTSSLVPRETVERRAEASDAVLYMIGQGQAIRSAALKALCERLAQRSGGRAFFPLTMEAVRNVFGEIRDELTNQYLIGYVPPSPRRDSAWHRIRVEVADGRYQVRARQGYRFRTPG